MAPKKITLINLKQPQKLPDDFIPKNLKIVTNAINQLFSIAFEVMQSSEPTNNLLTSESVQFCRAMNCSDIAAVAERLVVNHASSQLWHMLRSSCQEFAEKFVQKCSNAGENQKLKILARMWICWNGATHFVQHLLSWMERGGSAAASSSFHSNSSSGTQLDHHHHHHVSPSASIKSTCLNTLSAKLIGHQFLTDAVTEFMTHLRSSRDGDDVSSVILEMSYLKTILLQCRCYGDEQQQQQHQHQQQEGEEEKEELVPSLLFLPKYLSETASYYSREVTRSFNININSSSSSNNNNSDSSSSSSSSLEDFVKQVHTRLHEEKRRSELFLASFSRPSCDAVIQKNLILLPFDSLIDRNFNTLLLKHISNNFQQQQQEQQISSSSSTAATSSIENTFSRTNFAATYMSLDTIIQRLYSFASLPHVKKLDKLQVAFKNFIGAEATKLISSAQGVQQENQMIPQLLALHTKCDSIIISRCFRGDEGFRMKLRESFERSLRNRQTKIAELLAKQYDILMREGDKHQTSSSLTQQLSSSSSSSSPVFANEMSSSSSPNNNMGGGDMQRSFSSSSSANNNMMMNTTALDSNFWNLERLVRFTKLVPAKDVFETFYMRDLSKRLLQFKSLNEDLESTAVNRLKIICGPTIATRCNGMMKDIELSRDFVDNVSDQLREADPVGRFVPLVLTQGFWPATVDHFIPFSEEFKKFSGVFEKLYTAEYKKRKLQWSPMMSSCVLKARFNKGNKELTVSYLQSHILLMFNNSSNNNAKFSEEDIKKTFDSLTDSTTLAGEIASKSETPLQKQIQMMNEALQCALFSLIAAKILIVTEEEQEQEQQQEKEKEESAASKNNNYEIDNFITSNIIKKVHVNENFVHRQIKIRVAQVQLRAQEETEKTVQTTIAMRAHTIDAAIAKIMKARKKLSHWDLVNQTVEMTKLPLEALDVKKRIESLIDKNFLNRDVNDPSIYIYVA